MRLFNGSDPVPANSAAWLSAIVESSEDAIIGKTLDTVIRSWNASATRIFGYSADEAIGRSVLMLIPPELHHQEQDIVARVARGERVEYFETVRVRKDGQRVDISLSVSPIRNETGTVLGAAKIARDVTEANRLRAAERLLSEQLQAKTLELEKQIEEARLAQKQAEAASRTKSDFLATMSHELRTPLNAIAGYVDLLTMGIRGPLNDGQRQDLSRVKKNQETLLRLIEDVLDLAKVESGHVDFHAAEIRIDDVLATLETFIAPHAARKQIAFHFEPCGPDATAYADRHKVEQIMINLVSNAVKFTDDGSVTVRCRATDERLSVDVIDTGYGIPCESLEAIFEPFVQAGQGLTRTARGTGLGLSISRQLARAMGGDVVAASEVGKGSTFTLVLPRKRGRA